MCVLVKLLSRTRSCLRLLRTPAQPRSSASKRVALGEHTLTSDYWLNDRTISLRATLHGKDCIIKMRTPKPLLRELLRQSGQPQPRGAKA
ncbi:unnamed protein product [Vitrella brassicaformis CCMP3155]|uniref:Uncharacterized protein n=1 Tax=Vitrella brassicaformis (strain CCMP3155) TaxID=1169540 RepID=A0A0G4EM75_VITBC|nr:unnamed protein product [Vitrella brassicaformis CCMP3155]|eukprot:CEL98079.1 unnamed protein product [Vitrella brassicaformis CCMP3155]